MTALNLDELEALEAKATKGSWEVGDRYSVAGVMPEMFGAGRCACCNHGGPKIWEGVRDINGQQMLSHCHASEWTPDDFNGTIVQYADGIVRGVAVTSEKYGQVSRSDAAFIAAARNAVPELIAALRAAWAERDRLSALAPHLTAKRNMELLLESSDAQRERDARPSPEVVAKVREALVEAMRAWDADADMKCFKRMREALRLLEGKGFV